MNFTQKPRYATSAAFAAGLLSDPSILSAQALRSHLEKLEEAQVGAYAVSTFNALLFSPITNVVIGAALIGAAYFFARKHRRTAVLLAISAGLLLLCRHLTHLIDSPVDFAIYIVLPLVMSAILLRIHYAFRRAHNNTDDRPDRVRERRPRTIKVRGVISDDEIDEEMKRPAQVKLNRPFGQT